MESDQSNDAVVHVVYALAHNQDQVTLPLESGVSVRQFVERSGLLAKYPEILELPLVLGVFGKQIERNYVVKVGDRIEICRPLERDPREMRQEFWSQGKVIGGKDAIPER